MFFFFLQYTGIEMVNFLKSTLSIPVQIFSKNSPPPVSSTFRHSQDLLLRVYVDDYAEPRLTTTMQDFSLCSNNCWSGRDPHKHLHTLVKLSLVSLLPQKSLGWYNFSLPWLPFGGIQMGVNGVKKYHELGKT